MTPAPTPRPGLYPCEIGHIRLDPVRYTLRHHTYMWLVDLDHLPELPLLLSPLAGFRARDHFTGDAPSLRAGLERFLASRGIDLAGGRVLMLTHARVLGYVFNPLTLYWCHGPDGTPRCVVAEVHNTYGERHTYLLDPDEAGVAHVDKDFYVSPFFPVDGAYCMRLPLPADRLDLTVRLDRPGAPPFTATVRGTRREATPAALLRLALRHPLSTLAVSAGIRRHGIRLYLRGVPIQPRPSHRTTEKAT